MFYMYIPLGFNFHQRPYNVVKYHIRETSSPEIFEYFAVDEDSGIVYLKKSLMLDESRRKQYGVYIQIFIH